MYGGGNMITEKTNRKEDDELENSPLDNVKSAIMTLIPCVIAVIYLVMGFEYNLWHPGWIVFLLIPVFESVVESIYVRKIVLFGFPVLITAIYLYVGFCHNLWHPCWVIFITIPVFSFLAAMLNKFIKR